MNPRLDNPFRAAAGGRVDPNEVRAQLARILGSAPFKTSKRCSDFLQYVVKATLEGRAESVKERTLGIVIFNRVPDYDTNQDPIVRNTAGHVRRRLAQYYYSKGHEAELRIDLPPGSYVPEISSAAPPGSPAPAAEPEPAAPVPARRRNGWQLITLVAACLCALAATAAYIRFNPKPSALDTFWAPVLKPAGPVVICVGQGHTYKLDEAWDRYFEGQAGERPPLPKPAGSVPVGTVAPLWDRYIGLSDAQGVVRLSSLFTKLGKDVALRGGRATSLADLRGKAAVLLGAFNNEWTLRLTGALRFYFDAENGKFFVRDRRNPANRSWQVETDPDQPAIQTDYAIVSRVHNPTTEQTIVVAGGIKGGGTSAASEFLTNANYLEAALRDAPANWKDKNLQFVLSTRIYSGATAPPHVVAAEYW